MTPEDKSKELLEKFHQAMYAVIGRTDKGSIYSYNNRAKQCALLCVEEILAATMPIGARNGEERNKEVYWETVKEQIKKL